MLLRNHRQHIEGILIIDIHQLHIAAGDGKLMPFKVCHVY